MADLPRFTLILPAAGKSSRFGSNKLLAPLGGEPVIARTLSAFLGHPSLAAVVIAASQPNTVRQACVRVISQAESLKIPVTITSGGATRAHSVQNALRAAPEEIEWIAVHDAARPLITMALVDQTLSAAVEHGAATPALPVTLTVKEAHGPLPAVVKRTLSRQSLWTIQTPQIARRAAFLEAVDRCPVPLNEVTDDLQLIELAGGTTWLVPGDERNIKLTSAVDLPVAEMLLTQPA